MFLRPCNSWRAVFFAACLLCIFQFQTDSTPALAQSNVVIRVMSANTTSGNNSRYESPGLNIFQGLKPDIVAIQELKYASNTTNGINTPAAFREMLDNNFGTNFTYYRESSSFNIPNGIISRYPIIANGSWADSLVGDRSFAWARIDLPGTNDLYVVSVHLYSSGSSGDRNTEATTIKSQIQANFPANAWVIVAGDFNTDSRSEAAVSTFKTFLSDDRIPTDQDGDPDTNHPRNKPFDYVLPSFSLATNQVASVIGSRQYANGLVFVSTDYVPLSDVSPVQFSDSDAVNMQHMAVIKDFLIPVSGDIVSNSPPSIAMQPQDLAVSPGSNATFTVTANGTSPLNYQWRFNNTNISGATINPFTLNNVQQTNAGNYTVVITNLYGSVTSSIAILTITSAPPTILTNPASQSVSIGGSATFNVSATGAAPLRYQWRFNGTNILDATNTSYSLANIQLTNGGNYTVVVTNFVGSATSSFATLTVTSSNQPVSTNIIAQWNFNSLTPDTNTSTGVITPSTGSGTASLVGGATATFAGGDATLDPAGSTDNSGWNTTTYPAQGSGNKTRGVQFAVSTVGRQNIVVSWSSQSSNTGSKYGRLQYTTNGTDFVDFSSAFINLASMASVKTNSLASITGVNNNSSFAIRFVSEFESTAANTANANYAPASANYAQGGTMRYDMVTIYGAALVTNSPPAIAALLSAPHITAGQQFQMLVTGTTGSNYVVQASTNLGTGNWISIFTNASPFTFTDSNTNATQKFYRAIVQP